MRVKLKVCCIKTIQEAELAIRFGVDSIGLVGPMPSGPGIIDDHMIRRIVNHVGQKVETFLLTSETHADAIIAHYNLVKTSTLQLVDRVTIEDLQKIRQVLPSVRIVKVIHVVDESAKAEALAVSPYVDALLLDSGRPNAKLRTLGGTGQTHNWNISRDIVNQSNIPTYLAGGIRENNVAEAIRTVGPYGIDLCSGVRRNDELQSDLLEAFIFQLKTF